VSTATEYGPRISAIKAVTQASEADIATDEKSLKATRVVSSDIQRITVRLNIINFPIVFL
jgi:hypothetical protein